VKHIILGAGGAISRALSEQLLAADQKVKLVSRSGHTLDGAESARADLTDKKSTLAALEESSIAYLIVGLPYNLTVWKSWWPLIMRNAVEACQQRNSRLIFFDNVYMYGKVEGKMTESTPYNPCSRKGEIRARIAEYLMAEAHKGNIRAAIARAADFYGPHADRTSLPYIFYFGRMADGKKAQVLVDANKKHSYSYTADCGKALHLLATSDDSYNQVWHLPTAAPALTAKEFIHIIAGKLGVEPKYTILRKWMVRLAGLFDRQIREVHEMLYQNEYDYQFDSSKFERSFDFVPTSYETGIERTIEFFKTEGKIRP
jgi:nucleoside-diphosphate-sugar epimerase